MKGNNGTGNNVDRDEWGTPQWLFDKLNKQYKFKLDCCATRDNKKAHYFSSNFIFVKTKHKIVSYLPAWINPPFSKARMMFVHFFKVVNKGVAIYRCDNMETKIWQEVIFPNASWIFIPNKRIAYEGMKGSGSRFPSALIGYNVDVPKGLKGTVLRNIKRDENDRRKN